MVWTFLFFAIFTLACAVAPNFTWLIAFRLLAGIFASAPTAVIGGLYADIYGTALARGRSIALFMAVSVTYDQALPASCGNKLRL